MEATYEVGDILAVYADWIGVDYYFLIEGERKFDAVTGFVYPYRCLNDDKTGWGKFDHPKTRKVA